MHIIYKYVRVFINIVIIFSFQILQKGLEVCIPLSRQARYLKNLNISKTNQNAM